MVPKIRMHVAVVDPIVKAGVGDGDDDVTSVQTCP